MTVAAGTYFVKKGPKNFPNALVGLKKNVIMRVNDNLIAEWDEEEVDGDRNVIKSFDLVSLFEVLED